MDQPSRPDSPSPGPAGGTAWGPSLGLLAVAVGLVAGAFAWWWTSEPPPTAPAQAAPAAPGAPLAVAAVGPAKVAAPAIVAAASASPPAAPPPAAAPAPPAPTRIRRPRGPDEDQTPDLSDYVNEGERPTMRQVIDRLHQAGVYTGLGAFNPPGTRPPLVGLAVPEDFVLPDGYVRHHQATDDGQRIEAILMFAPDRQFFDASGQPVAIPKDRVVPPEFAPPGLPVRRIVIPPPADTGRRGS